MKDTAIKVTPVVLITITYTVFMQNIKHKYLNEMEIATA